MATIYIRDVPDEVAETLKSRAAADGKSLSAYLSALLTETANRPTNFEVLERIRMIDRTGYPTHDDIMDALEQDRRDRR